MMYQKTNVHWMDSRLPRSLQLCSELSHLKTDSEQPVSQCNGETVLKFPGKGLGSLASRRNMQGDLADPGEARGCSKDIKINGAFLSTGCTDKKMSFFSLIWYTL